MPPRKDFKTFNLCLRSHRVAVMLSVESTAKVSTLVTRVYSAFEQFDGTFACAVPSTQEYKQTQIRLAKSSRDDRGRVIPKKYEPLDEKASVRDQLQNWENVFVMWEDPNGNYRPVVELPSLHADPEE